MTKRNGDVDVRPYLLAYVAIFALTYMAINYPTYLLSLGISLELALAFAFIAIFHVTWLFISKVTENIKVEGFTAFQLFLFRLGVAFTITGVVTALLSMWASTAAFRLGLDEFLRFYADTSFKVLTGGITLIGASFPMLQSLYKQGASQPPQCGGEGGSGQQSK